MNKRNNLTHIRTLIKARGREMWSQQREKMLTVAPTVSLSGA
jgi:hypothetical protein